MIRDDNDRAVGGELPDDPAESCEPFAPSPIDWERPVPLDVAELPDFPIDALPTWLGLWADAVATALQVPIDLPALLGLGVVALAVAKKREAEVKPGWFEPLNLYVIIALPPGEGKTPVFRRAQAPVIAWQTEASERAAPGIAAKAEEKQLADERVKKLRRDATSAPGDKRDAAETEAKLAAVEAAEILVPAAPRLVVDDATPEVLAKMLSEQGGRLGVFSAEGGGPLEIAAGRYSEKGPNIEVWLNGHNGDPLTVDRIGRAPSSVDRPALTVALAVQPDVVAGLASKPGFRGRGLLARFLYSMPRSIVGARAMDPPPVPDDVAAEYAERVRALLDLECATTESGEYVATPVRFTEDARATHDAFRELVEPRLGPGGDLYAAGGVEWANKLGGLVARLATLFAVAEDATAETVERRHVDGAIALGEYALAHALAAFARMGADASVDDARHVLAWLRGRRGKVTRREIQRANQGRFPKVEPLMRAIDVLVEHRYLRELPGEGRTTGRPASPTYEVNPMTLVTEVTELAPRRGSVTSVILSRAAGPTGACESRRVSGVLRACARASWGGSRPSVTRARE